MSKQDEIMARIEPATAREPRRIVQIAVAPETDHSYYARVALCNDGTAWELFNVKDSEWIQLPEIPQ